MMHQNLDIRLLRSSWSHPFSKLLTPCRVFGVLSSNSNSSSSSSTGHFSQVGLIFNVGRMVIELRQVKDEEGQQRSIQQLTTNLCIYGILSLSFSPAVHFTSLPPNLLPLGPGRFSVHLLLHPYTLYGAGPQVSLPLCCVDEDVGGTAGDGGLARLEVFPTAAIDTDINSAH
ncbi:hypothetical protein FRC18_009340 [Serendipita sp. 400]|nr:hypothetical protein FRC18_009340 [Serendipita sp. 400]